MTGGAEGIGRAIVEAFCKDGHQVAFCDINAVSGQQTARDTGAIFHPVDVSDKEALESCMQQILDEWKDIDILINNVGISKFSSITETSVEDFDKILSVNLRPVFITSRLLAIHRKAQSDSNPYGRIINICSTRYLMSEPGSERLCSFQRWYLFSDSCISFIIIRMEYHSKLHCSRMDTNTRL